MLLHLLRSKSHLANHNLSGENPYQIIEMKQLFPVYMCSCCKNKPTAIWVVFIGRLLANQGSDSPVLFSTREASPGTPCPALGPALHEGYEQFGNGPAQGNKNGQGPERQGKAESTGVV